MAGNWRASLLIPRKTYEPSSRIMDQVIIPVHANRYIRFGFAAAVSFLVWLPEDDVQDYLKNMKQSVEEDVLLQCQWIQIELFRQSKLELSNICKNNQLNTTRTKLELLLRFAPVYDIHLNADKDLYFGDTESLPSRISELRRLGNSMKKQTTIYLKMFST